MPPPDVRVNQGDAGIEESSSRNGPDLEWMMKPAMDEGGTATGLPPLCPRNRRGEKRNRVTEKTPEKQGPWVQCVAGGGPLRKGTEARETLAGVEGLVKGGRGWGGGLGQEAAQRGIQIKGRED